MIHSFNDDRYQNMIYRRCGNSGLLLSAISLGLWQNFGEYDDFENGREMIFTAFDEGITHFDLANNYGPPPGSAETNFGRILKQNFTGYLRDELVISTKAGYKMWEGPYNDWGSRKYLISSLDQSLKRLQVEYVDIFYHHRPDPITPVRETMQALHDIVRSGKALYAGISNYKAEEARTAINVLRELGTPCLIHQPKYSLFERSPEIGLLDVLGSTGTGCIPFSPLAQGLLTDKYLFGIPGSSRISKNVESLKAAHLTPEKIQKISSLNSLAVSRNQTLAQMALAWLLKDDRISSVLIGASNPAQVTDSVGCLRNISFSVEELETIEAILI